MVKCAINQQAQSKACKETADNKHLNLRTMKKLKFAGKLSLNKETVAKLNNEQMNEVNGGSRNVLSGTTQATCTTCGSGSNATNTPVPNTQHPPIIDCCL